MSRFFLVLLLTASSAFAQQQLTAYDALKVVGKQVNRVALSRVISVTGVDGDPQPTRWNILVVDRHAPEGVREFQVANRRIIASGPPTHAVVGSTNEATVQTAKLNLDSSGAFSVASYTANTAHVNFSFVSYTLRTNERGQPVWIVTLQDDNRRPLGTIHINASRGNVTRVEGMYHGANMAHVEQDPADRGRIARNDAPRRNVEPRDVERQDASPRNSDDEYADTGNGEGIEEGDEDENVVKAEIKRLFHHTQDSAQRIFNRVRRPFEDFINR